jgi:DinB superfamily
MTTSSEYAAELERANEDAIAFATSCSPEEWAAVVPGEDWSVGVVVHHVAEGYDLVSRWIDCALGGRPIEDTGEGIDAANLRHAQDFAGVGVDECVELLRNRGAAAVAKLHRLGESDLEKTTAFGPAGGQPFSVEQFCLAAAGHVHSHLGRARSAVGRDVDT